MPDTESATLPSPLCILNKCELAATLSKQKGPQIQVSTNGDVNPSGRFNALQKGGTVLLCRK